MNCRFPASHCAPIYHPGVSWAPKYYTVESSVSAPRLLHLRTSSVPAVSLGSVGYLCVFSITPLQGSWSGSDADLSQAFRASLPPAIPLNRSSNITSSSHLLFLRSFFKIEQLALASLELKGLRWLLFPSLQGAAVPHRCLLRQRWGHPRGGNRLNDCVNSWTLWRSRFGTRQPSQDLELKALGCCYIAHKRKKQ